MSDRTPDRVQHGAPTWSPALVTPVVRMIDGRWVLPILHALQDGPLRRNALHERVSTVTDKVLTETLRRMETHKLLLRTTIASVPVEVNYALTPRALSLWPVLSKMQQWALDHTVQLQQNTWTE